MKPFTSRNIKSLIEALVFLLIIGMWFLPSFGSVRIGITLVLALCMFLTGIRQAPQQESWHKQPRILIAIAWLLLGLYIYLAYHISVSLPVGIVGTVVLFLLMFVCAYMALSLARKERKEELQVVASSFFLETRQYEFEKASMLSGNPD